MPRSVAFLTIASLVAIGLVSAGVTPAAAATSQYTVQQVTGITGGVPCCGVAANDAGQVASTSPAPPSCTGLCLHAFLWSAGAGARDLGTLGGLSSSAAGINGAGHVVGASAVDSAGTQHAFLWTPAGMRDLGLLPGRQQTAARAVNDADQVVGSASFGGPGRAFSWTAAGGMVDMGALPGDDTSQPLAINAAGEAVGISFSSTPGPGGPPHMFAWSAATGMRALTPPAGFSLASLSAINRWGQMVGQFTNSGGKQRPLLFDGSTWTDLGVLPGDDQGFATGIDDGGEVVGVSTDQPFPSGSSHAFRWTAATGMVDLSSVLPAAPIVHLTAATNVTNGGLIAATSGFSLGAAPFFLLTPLSAPPELHLPGATTAAATDASGAIVAFEASASGGTAPVTVACAPASGSRFPVGVTAVRCTATDAVAQTASGTFTVTVTAPASGSTTGTTPTQTATAVPLPPPTGAGTGAPAPDRRPLLLALALVVLGALGSATVLGRRRSRTGG